MGNAIHLTLIFSSLIFTASCRQNKDIFNEEQEKVFEEAALNGPLVNEGYNRCGELQSL